MKEREGDGCLDKVLPGVEFSVSIRTGGEEPTVIHIVVIFDDRRPELIDGIARAVCDEDGKPRYDDPDNGAFTEDGFAKVLRGIGLNAVLIGHEKSAGREARRDVSSLGADRANEVILTEFVDAVEIRNKRRELDIKRLIEAYPKDAVPFVVGSDCHDWATYPGTEGGEISFSSLKCLPTFEGLLMAITDLSRIKVGDCSFFSASSSKLDSLRLAVDGKDFDIPLSPGINAIIGDNSIGKSMMIHQLTGCRYVDDSGLADGYKAYCTREGIEISSNLPASIEFKFDDQDSVRKTLEELHSGESRDDYFGKYFQAHVDIGLIKSSLKRFFDECIAALKSKACFNDSRGRLDEHEMLLLDLPRSEKLTVSLFRKRFPSRILTGSIPSFVLLEMVLGTSEKIMPISSMRWVQRQLRHIATLWRQLVGLSSSSRNIGLAMSVMIRRSKQLGTLRTRNGGPFRRRRLTSRKQSTTIWRALTTSRI